MNVFNLDMINTYDIAAIRKTISLYVVIRYVTAGILLRTHIVFNSRYSIYVLSLLSFPPLVAFTKRDHEIFLLPVMKSVLIGYKTEMTSAICRKTVRKCSIEYS